MLFEHWKLNPLEVESQCGVHSQNAMVYLLVCHCRGLINKKAASPEEIYVSSRREESLEGLGDLGVHTSTDNHSIACNCGIVILCVKPDVLGSVLEQLKDAITPSHLVVSIAAGVPISYIEERLPASTRVVRIMCNTPAIIAESASAFSLGTYASAQDGEAVSQIFGALGIVLQVKEKQLDAVTGLSGSGPAYVFIMIEALADGGVRAGLPRDVAHQLAVQTVIGSAKMVLMSDKHPAQLKDNVASPGGTTIAGIHALERGGFRACLINAVVSATEQSKKLGQDV
mmetsp:Transcript_30789/g.49807  ORF Transcript_30789/g.49807 Transcript_30789/m.49807 type:complete len:285 (-) Transcript_30789:407-1261(-)